MNQVLVKVIDPEKITRVIPFRTFLYKNEREEYYTLIGQSESDGTLIPGNPNLPSQYQSQSSEQRKSVGRAVDTGIHNVSESGLHGVQDVPRETKKVEEEVIVSPTVRRNETKIEEESVKEEPKKRGRKPKLQAA